MDSFAEQIVVKQNTVGDTLKRIGIGVLALLLAAVLFLALSIVGLTAVGILLAIGSLYGGYYLITNLNVEYEYIVTNGELDVDKIIARRKRKRLLTVKASTFEEYGIVTDMPEKDGLTVFMVTGADMSDYYADFNHPKHGKCRLVFSPDEKIREELDKHIRIKNKS